MSESYITREYRPDDIPALTELWMRVFGDSREFVEGYFRMLPDFGSCVLTECGGRVIAEAGVITGLELQKASGGAPECGYIYAVAVDPEFRGQGFGREIVRAARDKAIEREAYIICTLPADDSLYDFYSACAGLEPALYRETYSLPAKPVEMTMKLTATEYMFFREDLLRGKTFLRPSFFTADFLRFACECGGGGLYASMSGICTASVEDGICFCREVIAASKADCDAVAASVAFELGCKKAVYCLPAESGERFIAADPGKVPADTVWNIAFE